jgi:hypothetical protein
MPSFEISDRKLAMILAGAGPLLIAIAFARNPHPFNMLPGMDGAFTCGQLGFVLAMLHGIKFRRALQLMLPIVAIELACCIIHQVSGFAVLGVQALLYGLVGLWVTAPLRTMPLRTLQADTPLHIETAEQPS